MNYEVENKTVLVTGANRGIGKAIAESFLARGAAKVYAAVRNPESASALVAKYGDRVVPLRLDLSKPKSIVSAAEIASDVEVVVNNAGVLTNTQTLDGEAMDNLAFEIDVNLYGLLRMAQAFAPILKANGGGAFVQLNSVVSMKTFSNVATYSASKAAAYALTQALREELAGQGTAVVSVHPGPIATEMMDGTGFEEVAEPPERVAEGIIEAIENKVFHLFPDSLAKKIGAAYQGFAENVVLAEMSEG